MIESQLTQIRNYLLEKKLPIDILLEVQDHFVSQINDLQKEENLSFDDALEKTKKSWEIELKPYWNGEIDLIDRSKLLRETNKINFKVLVKKSLTFSIPVILILFFLSKIISFQYFEIIFVAFVGLIYFSPLINYLIHLQDFKLIKKYQNYVLVSIQEYSVLMIGGIYFYFRFITDGYKLAEVFSSFSLNNFNWDFVLGFLIVNAILMLSFFVIFSQKIYLQRIEKVKPFLQYLKPSN